jgi:AcrR family transcriptional regulator
MRRNRNAEQTRKDIVDAAIRLFMENGYEQTSVSDILKACGNMSRGAFYHHFSSKQAVVFAIPDRLLESDDEYRQILVDRTATGLEKARRLLSNGMTHFIERPEHRMFTRILNEPNLVHLILDDVMNTATPMLEQFILQGNEDGSMHVDDPIGVAEMVAVLLNLWCMSPFPATEQIYLRRFELLKTQLEFLGIPVIDEEMLPLCRLCAKAMAENGTLVTRTS